MSPRTLLKVGTMGGSLTFARIPGEEPRYVVTRNEGTLADLTDDVDPSELHGTLGAFASLEEAFEAADRYPWWKFHPVKVDPEVHGTVWEAVRSRAVRTLGSDDLSRWSTGRRWHRECGSPADPGFLDSE